MPGWDCHGLPIELNVEKELGRRGEGRVAGRVPPRLPRVTRTKFVASQRDDFKRLGVLGDWDDPYLTMTPAYQAAIVRALGQFVARGLVYKGKKPVHWCLRDRTALAEAEVEYETTRRRRSTSSSRCPPTDTARSASRVPGARRPRRHRADLDDDAVDDSVEPGDRVPSGLRLRRVRVSTAAAVHRSPTALGRRRVAERPPAGAFGAQDRDVQGRDARSASRFRHPLYDRDSLGVLGDYVTLEQGTGAVHTAPGHGADDFATGVRYGLDIYAPIGATAGSRADVGIVGGLKVFEANPVVEAALARTRPALVPHRRSSTRIRTAGAAISR